MFLAGEEMVGEGEEWRAAEAQIFLEAMDGRSGPILAIGQKAFRVVVEWSHQREDSGDRGSRPVFAVLDTVSDGFQVLLACRQSELRDRCVVYPFGLEGLLEDLPFACLLVVMDAASFERSGFAICFEKLVGLLPVGSRILVCGSMQSEMGLFLERHRLRVVAQGLGYSILESCQYVGTVAETISSEVLRGIVEDIDLAYSDGNVCSSTLRATYRMLTVAVRREIALQRAKRSQWPYLNSSRHFPERMPNGKPWPKVSVITPTFRQAAYLEQTILSVLNQTYPNIEHIVIDGGSDDGTREILERYDSHLAYWVSEKDRGQSHAINKGFARATGQVLTWLNSDDFFAPEAIASAVVGLVQSQADMVAGIALIYEGGSVVGKHLTSCVDGALPLRDLLDLDYCWLRGQFFHQPEVLFTRALWERAGGYVVEDLHYSMDYELWVRMAYVGAQLHVIGAPIAFFRRHDAQKTFSVADFEPELREVRDRFIAEKSLVVETGRERPEEKRRLTVVMYNDNGFQYGAGIGHRRLAETLQHGGHRVLCISAKELRHKAEDVPVLDVVEALLKHKPDVVLFGNIHDAKQVPELVGLVADKVLVLFYMHDYWLITGRCAYPGGCAKYLMGCDASCPTSDEYPSLEPSKIAGAWEAKLRLHHLPRPPQVVTNTRAVADRVEAFFREQASLDGRALKPEVVRLAIPEGLAGADKRVARRILKLPESAFILLFSAGSLDDKRKGLRKLLDALHLLQLPDCELVCLGREEAATNFPCEKVHFVGYVRDPERLQLLYAAADVYVGPSLDETFGQVFVEAASCGTPSIGYRVGGVPEAIFDRWTGLLADDVTAEGLAAVLFQLWSDPKLRGDLGVLAPLVVKNEFSTAKCLNQLHQVLKEGGRRYGWELTAKLPLLLGENSELKVERLHGTEVQLMAGFGTVQQVQLLGEMRSRRWAYAPRCDMDVVLDKHGPCYLIIEYQCLLKEQKVAVKSGTKFLGEFVMEAGQDGTHFLTIPFYGSKGTQRVQIFPKRRHHHVKNAPEKGAFYLLGVTIVSRELP